MILKYVKKISCYLLSNFQINLPGTNLKHFRKGVIENVFTDAAEIWHMQLFSTIDSLHVTVTKTKNVFFNISEEIQATIERLHLKP